MHNQAIDPAALRLYYLQQLGVNVYVSRDAAAVAEAEVDDALVAAAVAAPPVQEVPTIAAVTESAPVARKSLLTEVEADAGRPLAKPAMRVSDAAPAVAAMAADESAALVPFQLLFFMPEPRLAVAMQIPALSRPVLPDAQARLLQNLLRWLGIKSAGIEGVLLHFRWPLPGMPAGDAVAAGRNLQVFLEQTAATHPWQRLLLLGQGPGACLQAASAGASLPFQTWATHSLAEMLAVPELKREVWQHLLSLHAQL